MVDRKRPQAPLLAWAALYAVIFILFVPLAMMILTSVLVKTEDGKMNFTWKFWLDVFADPQLAQNVWNSLFIAAIASGIAVLLGTLAALALAKTRFFGQRYLQIAASLSLVFPEIVFALSLLSLFFIINFPLGLGAVILAHISFALPYVILTVGARAVSLDKNIDDSAFDLGASDWQILTKIHLPLLKPAMISGFFLSFILSFDDFLITFFVNGVGSDTLPIKLYTSMKSGITPQLNALATIIFLASAILMIFLLRSQTFSQTLESLNQTKNLR